MLFPWLLWFELFEPSLPEILRRMVIVFATIAHEVSPAELLGFQLSCFHQSELKAVAVMTRQNKTALEVSDLRQERH